MLVSVLYINSRYEVGGVSLFLPCILIAEFVRAQGNCCIFSFKTSQLLRRFVHCQTIKPRDKLGTGSVKEDEGLCSVMTRVTNET